MNKSRARRHLKIRRKVIGTSDRPRLAVFKSNQHIYAQLIDDSKHATIASASDLKVKGVKKGDRAYEIGKALAEQALKLKIKKVVFDRGGFLYHGRIAQVSKGARDGGLEL